MEVDAKIKCFNCDSGIDENCSTLKDIKKLNFIDCDESCAVWISDYKTLRGCTPDEIDESKKSICDFDECNKEIFPFDRMKCVKCDEVDDFCIEPDTSYSYPCKNYSPDDECYTMAYGEQNVIRGCTSDNDDEYRTCAANIIFCELCKESSCNAINTSTECYICNDDLACGYNPRKSSDTKICESSCFAYNNETNYIRGCLKDFPELKPQCEENTELCQTCTGKFCNNMKMIAEYCAVCNSANCKSQINVPTICGEATFDQAGCYLSDRSVTGELSIFHFANVQILISHAYF